MSPFDNITLSFDDLIMSIDIAKNELNRISSVIWKDTKIEKINYDKIWKYQDLQPQEIQVEWEIQPHQVKMENSDLEMLLEYNKPQKINLKRK
jgi:hypothetical protein